MRTRIVFAGILIAGFLLAPGAIARQRAVRSPANSILTFTLSIPPGQRLATGAGVGVLYDPAVLEFVEFTDVAQDAFYLSKSPELVADPPYAGETALLRLTWVNVGGQWPAALNGGPLASVKFRRVGDGSTDVRVVSLTTDDLHAIAPARMRIGSEAAVSGVSLEARELTSSYLRTAPLPVVHAFPAGQCTPDVDGNGRVDALTDGIILLRYLFGFTGNPMTSGAIGAGATRTSSSAIKTFIDQTDCIGLLDIDQNDAGQALTDGVILMRQFFGFAGDDLIDGALAPNAGRISGDGLTTVIESYSVPRTVLMNNSAVASGASVTDATGDFSVGAVGSGQSVTLTQGTDFRGRRTVGIARSGTGQVSVVLPPAEAGPPASTPLTVSSTIHRIASLADVATQSWDNEAGFRRKWFYTCGRENRLPEAVQSAEAPLVSTEACWTRFNRLHVAQYRAVELLSSCGATDSACYQSKDAMLFIHGMDMFLSRSPGGGGSGTWGTLPSLAQQMGMVPFEFRWITAARFDDVATDLQAAIRIVAAKTGRKVHIVAHSFGGLLVRTLLQSPEGASIAPYIASVVTLGTPHSGIASAKSCPAPFNVPIPDGADNTIIGGCAQISCYQAGLNNLNTINAFDAAAIRDVYDLDGDAGYLIGRLAQSSSLPNLDWLALIGLLTESHLLGPKTFRTGDDLISYEGQRFLPSFSLASSCPGNGITTPLATGSTYGSGRLWERVLGFTGQPAPGGVITTPTDSGFDKGYSHNSAVDFFGSKQEAKVPCSAVAGCTHDTVRYLFGTTSPHTFFSGSSWISTHAGAAPQTQSITFTVTILDSVTRVPIPNANVSIYFNACGPSVLTNALGQASVTVPFAANFGYQLRVNASGYVSLQETFFSAGTLASTPTNLGTRLLVSQLSTGYGTLAGTVQNAITGFGIANAAVTVRRSDRATLSFSGTADGSGFYNAGTLAAGTYVVSASAPGFLSGASQTTVAANTSNVGNVPLSPQLSAGQARIVLTWGANPSDLDSHLTKTRSNGSLEYHIYYLAKTGTNGDNLDVDDVTSFGPETVTIQNIDPTAHYRYWVHLYAGSGTIAASPARVTITTSAGTSVFNAPGTATGREWVVFDIVGGQVVPCTGDCNDAPGAQDPPTQPKDTP